MKISIITVSYNSVKTIARTIESVLKQDYPDLEYIIIDGGSTDGTLDVIEKYKQKITHVISEPDKGISDAFNKGLHLATGEIISILNSDDWHEPETLQLVASKLTNSTTDFVVGTIRYWDERGNNFIVFPDKKYREKILYRMPQLNHPASFFKAEVYRSVGNFNLKYRYAMDYDFFLRVFQAKKQGVFIDVVLTNMSSSGASDKHAINAYRESFMIAPSKPLAAAYFIFFSTKYCLRKTLTALKLDSIITWFRQMKYKDNK